MLKWGDSKMDNEYILDIKKKMDEVKNDPAMNEKEKHNRIIKLATELGKALLEKVGVIPPDGKQ